MLLSRLRDPHLGGVSGACAAGRDPDKHGNCMDLPSLTKIARSLSPEPSRKIPQNTRGVVQFVAKQLGIECSTDTCLADRRPDVIGESALDLFAPQSPETWRRNRHEWLSNVDLDNLLTPLSNEVPDFEYLGTFSMDFARMRRDNSTVCVSTMCKFSWTDLMDRGKHRWGMVINTDYHDQPGRHWVALVGDARPGRAPRIMYYNSTGARPPREICEFARDVRRDLGEGLQTSYNDVRHQYENSECGMFSAIFVISMANGVTPSQFAKSRWLDDAAANRARDILFRW